MFIEHGKGSIDAGLPPGSLFREKGAIGTFLQIEVLKGSLFCAKGPYFDIFYENNAKFHRKNGLISKL